MEILGLQGSPRKKGNTQFLLSAFLKAAEERGAVSRLVRVAERRIEPCKEFVVCETKGTCPIRDDMDSEIYGLIRRAEVVVLASPIFFYNMTAQLKALVDRCQVFWARKYRLKLADPLKATRRGVLLSVAATRGKTLFDGLQQTRLAFIVPAGAFTPKPKVDSALVTLAIGSVRQRPAADEAELFLRVIKAAFSQRRKTLRNSLSQLRYPKAVMDDVPDATGIDLGRRAETLSVEEFVPLSDHFSGHAAV